MMRRSMSIAPLAVALVAAAAPAAAASTFTSKVEPAGAGTTTTPKAHKVTLDIQKIKQGPDGNATVALHTLATAFPIEFADQLAKYETCDPKLVINENSQPKCPEKSIIGTGNAGAYLPAFRISATSDYGYLYKIGDAAVRGWFRASKPTAVAFVISGDVTQGEAPFGPTITWDFKPAANGKANGGIVAWTNSFTPVFEISSQVPPPPVLKRASCESKARKITNRAERRAALLRCAAAERRRCESKARKITNRAKRRAALRRCRCMASHRRYQAAKTRATAARAQTRQAAESGLSPFMSTGCAAAAWTFQVRMDFEDGSKESLDSKVDCASGEGDSGEIGGGDAPPLPVPLP